MCVAVTAENQAVINAEMLVRAAVAGAEMLMVMAYQIGESVGVDVPEEGECDGDELDAYTAAGLLMGGTEGAARAMRPDVDMDARLVDWMEVMEKGKQVGMRIGGIMAR